jgi:cell division initiation protein
MRLSAADIRQQQFAVKLIRGFDPQEVDAFLEEVADDFEELTRENNLLKEQLAALEERAKEIESREKTVHETLITTQKIAEEFKENARREAELVLREAHLRSEKFMQDAREEHAKLNTEISGLKRHRQRLAEEMLHLLSTYKRMVEQELAGGGAS